MATPHPIPGVKDDANFRNRVLLEGQALKKGVQTGWENGQLCMSPERSGDPEAYHKAVQDLAAHELNTLHNVQLHTRIKILQMAIAYLAHALEFGSQGKRQAFQYCLRKYLDATFIPGAELDDEDGKRRCNELRIMRRKCKDWEEFLPKVKAYVVVELDKLQSLIT